MSLIFIAFLALFIPGLLTIVLVVLIALPRSVRDDQRRKANQCLECGRELRTSDGVCPECGHSATDDF